MGLELGTEARNAHKALQNNTISTNALRWPNMGKETSAGSQQTTARGSETDPGNKQAPGLFLHKEPISYIQNFQWNLEVSPLQAMAQYFFFKKMVVSPRLCKKDVYVPCPTKSALLNLRNIFDTVTFELLPNISDIQNMIKPLEIK